MRMLLVAGVLGTMLAMAAPARAVVDPTGDTFLPDTIDVTDLSACQSATSLVITMTFAAPIAPPAGAPPPSNALYGYIDLDLDADAATGDMSHVEQYGPMGAGTDLGIEASLSIPEWGPVTQTISFEPVVGDETRVPISFTTSGLTVTVPLTAGVAPSVHVGAVIGDFSDPTDVAPNTGYVAAVSCCGNGVVDAGEDCDGTACCTDTCTFAAGTSCSDGNPCTVSDACSAGTCAGGGPLDCDDADPCFDDSCDASSGCVHTDRTGFPGVTCAFERYLPLVCKGQPIDANTLGKAKDLVDHAATASTAKQKKLVKKARKALKAFGKTITRAQKKAKVTVECADAQRALLDDINARLDRATGG